MPSSELCAWLGMSKSMDFKGAVPVTTAPSAAAPSSSASASTSASAPATVPNAAATAASATSSAVGVAIGFDVKAALEFHEDPGTLRTFLQVFTGVVPTHMTEVKTHFASKNYPLMANAAHKIKGDAECIFAKRLVGVAQRLHHFAEQHKHDPRAVAFYPAMIQDIEAELDVTLRTVAAFLKAPS
jgi:HPt (histidine-containing phosphotransfer) domain-containing protein